MNIKWRTYPVSQSEHPMIGGAVCIEAREGDLIYREIVCNLFLQDGVLPIKMLKGIISNAKRRLELAKTTA